MATARSTMAASFTRNFLYFLIGPKCPENVPRPLQNFTILEEQIPSIRSQTTGENEEFQRESREISLRFQIEVKMLEKNSFQRQNLQNFAVLEEKIPSIRCEMIGESAEFPVESKEIRSTIQVEV